MGKAQQPVKRPIDLREIIHSQNLGDSPRHCSISRILSDPLMAITHTDQSNEPFNPLDSERVIPSHPASCFLAVGKSIFFTAIQRSMTPVLILSPDAQSPNCPVVNL